MINETEARTEEKEPHANIDSCDLTWTIACVRRAPSDGRDVIHPESRRRADGLNYRAMRRAILAVVPRPAPGLTLGDALAAALPRLQTVLFPAGAGAGWWFKTVQLDLEAKRLLVREKTSPTRIHRG